MSSAEQRPAGARALSPSRSLNRKHCKAVYCVEPVMLPPGGMAACDGNG